MGKTEKATQPESFISPVSEYGLLRAASPDHAVWLYAKVPWSSALLDGADDQKRTQNAGQLMAFFDGLAGMVTMGAMKYRYMMAGQYREFHILSTSMPMQYSAPVIMRGTDLGRWLNSAYRDPRFNVQKQNAYVGVKLNPGGNLLGRKRLDPLSKMFTGLNRLAYSWANGQPMFEEFLPDAHRIEKIMLNAGMEPLTLMEDADRAHCVSEMKSWWVSSGNANALPIMAENDHIHLFPDTATCTAAREMWEDKLDCDEWHIRGEYPATMCFAKASTFARNPVNSSSNQWIARLLEVGTAGGANAVGVSIRGKVEPGVITADQIRRNQHTIEEAMEERYKHNRTPTGEMQDVRDRLEYKQAIYRQPDMPPTLIDMSVAVLAAGNAHQALDSLQVVPQLTFVNLNTAREQLFGFKSMQVCSPVRVTPYELHWSASCIAGAGLNSFAHAGDKTGALLGFSEANRQPVYLGTTMAQDEDRAPCLVIVGSTGSGKTMCLLSLIFQWAKIDARDGKGKTPCILIDPKENSDFSDSVLAQGGQVFSMDSDLADGIFDPYNVLQSAEEAKEMAAIMLSNILSPSGQDADLELAITAMLSYGVSRGAKCVGVAIEVAYRAFVQAQKEGKRIEGLPENVVNVRNLVRSAVANSQYLRIIIGTSNDTKPLKVAQALTLIKAGARSLVPAEGSENTVTGRIQRWVLRMTVLGAGTAVRGRDGVVALDEAWVALGEGSGMVVQQWMRLARSQRFMPVLASQKVKEFNDAGLQGGISREILLSLENPEGGESPAKAALLMSSIADADGQIISRMPILPEKDNGAPNWASLQRLRGPEGKDGKRPTLRGSVAYFKDGSALPVPVEIAIPEKLLKEISTTATDVIAREKAKQEAQSRQKAMAAQQGKAA